MKELNIFLTENKYEDAIKSATRVLVNKFGFQKIKRGSIDGVEKDGKACIVQVCEMPYNSCLVVDSRFLFTNKKIRMFDYLVYIDTRKKFQDIAYIIEIQDLMKFIKDEHKDTFTMWPTSGSERGTDKINPLGVTIKLSAIKPNAWCTEVTPTEEDGRWSNLIPREPEYGFPNFGL